MKTKRPGRPLQIPRWLAVAVLPVAACSPPSEHDGGTDSGVTDGGDDGGTDGGQSACGSGCVQYMYPDGGLVFYPDGGPYCLC